METQTQSKRHDGGGKATATMTKEPEPRKPSAARGCFGLVVFIVIVVAAGFLWTLFF